MIEQLEKMIAKSNNEFKAGTTLKWTSTSMESRVVAALYI